MKYRHFHYVKTTIKKSDKRSLLRQVYLSFYLDICTFPTTKKQKPGFYVHIIKSLLTRVPKIESLLLQYTPLHDVGRPAVEPEVSELLVECV